MNERLLKIRDFLNRGDLSFFVSVAVICVLPVYVYYLPPLMILWIFTWFLDYRSDPYKFIISRNKSFVLFSLFIIFFLWQIIGLFFAENVNSGFERIIKRLAFLLFPIVLLHPCERIKDNIKLLLKLFAIFTFIYIIFCFINAFSNSLTIHSGKLIFNPHPPEFDYENYFISLRFSPVIHPSYLSMYVILSVIIILEIITDRQHNFQSRSTYLWLFILLVLLAALYFLSSRAAVLATVIVIPIFLLLRYFNRLSKWTLFLSVFIAIVLLAVIAKTNPRINSTIDGISMDNITEIYQNDNRIMIWKSAFGVIENNWLFGVGTGDASEELKKEFISRGYTEGYYDNLNTHNQFLEIFLENGIIGLAFFIGILGYIFYSAISNRNLILGIFLIMMIIFFMFETILNRLAGITFFPLFTFLLLHLKQTDNKN